MRSVDSGCGTGGVAAVVMVVVCCSVDGERNWHAAAVSQKSLPAGARRAALSLMGKQPTQQNGIRSLDGKYCIHATRKSFHGCARGRVPDAIKRAGVAANAPELALQISHERRPIGW